MSEGYKCKCGHQFSGQGQFRACEAFITDEGKSGVICPKCGQAYVNWKPVTLVAHRRNNASNTKTRDNQWKTY